MSAEFSDQLGTKSFDEIVEDTLNALTQRDERLSNINPGSVLRTLVEVFSENEDMQNYYMEYIYNNMNIDNCVGEELDRSVVILGMTREDAKPATGEVSLYTGDQPAEYDITIPNGYIVSTNPDSDGEVVEFYVDGDHILKAGETSITVPVICNTPGYMYVPAGTICVLPTSLQGIHYVKNRDDINSGSDIESDDEFRERIHSIRETFGKCTDSAISSAVGEIQGISNVAVIDMYKGVGTTGIMITTDVIPPSDDIINEVIEVVNSVKASGIAPFIIYTEIKSVDINITVSGIANTNTDIIIDAINNYCASLTSGETLIIKQLEKTILNSLEDDSIDISTIEPNSNVTATESEMIRPGTITINGEVVR